MHTQLKTNNLHQNTKAVTNYKCRQFTNTAIDYDRRYFSLKKIKTTLISGYLE